MSLQKRLANLQEQKRAHVHGTIEYIDDKWLFFDEESDESILLEDMIDGDIEVLRYGRWMNGKLRKNGIVQFPTQSYSFKSGERVRLRKRLSYAYEQWLESLPEHTFYYFIQQLNQFDFSLYDCLYCYNSSLFGRTEGANFIVYDNTNLISNIQHFYERGTRNKDYFEITFSTGKRLICKEIS